MTIINAVLDDAGFPESAFAALDIEQLALQVEQRFAALDLTDITILSETSTEIVFAVPGGSGVMTGVFGIVPINIHSFSPSYDDGTALSFSGNLIVDDAGNLLAGSTLASIHV